MNNSPWEAQYTLRFILYQTPILNPLGNVRLLSPQIQENVWACSKYFASLLKMKDKSLTLCYPGNFLLGPIVRWMCSPPVSQDSNKAQGQRNSIPRVLWTRSALPFSAETQKHHLTSMVSPIISASSIQKHQEGKTWSIIYMFFPYKWGLWTFLRYYFLYFHSFTC